MADLAQLRSLERKPPRGWWIASAVVVALVAAVGGWILSRPSDRPQELVGDDLKPAWSTEYSQPETPIADVLVFEPPPPGAKLVVDGIRRPLPADGFLRLEAGRHRVELSDSSGRVLCDTLWNVPRSTRPHIAKPPLRGEGRKHP